MSLPSLYNITDSMLALMESDEATEEQIEAAFGQLQEKNNSICHFRADLKGEIEKFKAEEKRLSSRRKSMENLVDRLENYVRYSMARLDINTVEAGTFKITLSPSAGRLEITDEQAIPAKYRIITTSYDRDAIKRDIKAGEDVPGAKIEPGHTLRIK